jgi:hypothetical protein
MKTVFRMFLIAIVLAPTARAQEKQEAPKALILVPWKPSEPGKAPEISTKVDNSRNPIDNEAFMRMLRYYEIAKTNARSKQ